MATNLPVELVELIFAHASSSSVSTVKALRIACRAYAEVGFPYLFDRPEFTYLYWRGNDDARRLDSWSRHPQLRQLLRTLTLNLSQMDEYTGRHSSFFQYWAMEPEERDAVLREGWGEYYDKETRRKLAGSTFEGAGVGIPDAAGRFESLEEVRVVFNECPYESNVLRRAFADPSSRRFEAHNAREAFELLPRVLSACPHLTRLEIDRLPVSTRPSVEAENLWGAFARGAGRRLEEIRLALDFSGLEDELEETSGWGEPVGALLKECSNLRMLAVAKHRYHPLEDRRRKTSGLNQLLLRESPSRLTELKFEGFAVAEEELLGFVKTQVPTLKRLRLGGRGIANPREKSRGGIWLSEGTWFGFFRGLRREVNGQRGVLERIHLEGDFGQADEVVVEGQGQDQDQDQEMVEKYDFYPTTDDKWEPVDKPEWLRGEIAETALDGRAFEQYVLGHEELPYPGFAS